MPSNEASDFEIFEIEVFFDGACPLCVREIRMLRRLDARGRIRFTDIAETTFDERAVGLSWEALMARIHGRLPDGTLVEGVEVFRRLYAAVGFRRLVAVTRWPVVSQLCELGYRVFAAHRLRLTGRCEGDRCQLPTRHARGDVAHAHEARSTSVSSFVAPST